MLVSHIIKPKWFTKYVLKTVRLKHRRFCEYKQHCSNTTMIRYVEVQSKVEALLDKIKKNMKVALDWLV